MTLTTVLCLFWQTHDSRAADYYTHELRTELSKTIAKAFNLPEGDIFLLLQSFAGLPEVADVRCLLNDTLQRWLPTLRAGWFFCTPDSKRMACIPHTVLLTNPEIEPDAGHWRFTQTIEEGPMSGRIGVIRVSHRMACAMLTEAVGVRAAFRLERPRPYDLHGLRLLVGLVDNGGHGVRLVNIFPSADFKVLNRTLMNARLATCSSKRFKRICWDCGADSSVCSLARRDTVLSTGACKWCRKPKVVVNPQGVCILCQDQMISHGILPRLPKTPQPLP